VEIVHIELFRFRGYLPNKRREVGVPEIFGEDLLGEGYDIDDCESYVIFVPANYFLVFGVLSMLACTSRISYVLSKKEAMVSLFRPLLLRCWRYCCI
jgi:hypothetical protein